MFKSWSPSGIHAEPISGGFNAAHDLAPIKRLNTENTSEQDQDAKGSLDSFDVMIPSDELTISQINIRLDQLLASHEIYQAADFLSKHAHKFIDAEPEQKLEFAALGDELSKTLQSTGIGFELSQQVQFAIDALKLETPDNDMTVELHEQLKRRAELGLSAPSFAA